jgi:hypothetical protein
MDFEQQLASRLHHTAIGAVNVFGTGITLLGHADLNHAAVCSAKACIHLCLSYKTRKPTARTLRVTYAFPGYYGHCITVRHFIQEEQNLDLTSHFIPILEKVNAVAHSPAERLRLTACLN